MPYLLGIDAGTTTLKAGLFDEEGGLLSSVAIECSLSYTDENIVEIDMEWYWNACKQCIHTIYQESKIDLKDISALAISSQGVTFVPVDRQGKALRKGIVFYDTRARNEANELIRRFGLEKIFETTGQPEVSAIFESPKIMWIRNYEPECFQNIHKILLVHDYLTFKFTGEFVSVHPLLSSSLLFDIRRKKWWEEMLDFLHLSDNKLPGICKPGTPVGPLTAEAASETGMSIDTLVVAGAIDQECGMLGVGNIHPGLISESTGSVLAVHTISNNPFHSGKEGIYSFCHVTDDTYALMGICPTAGAAFKWFKETFGEKEDEYADTLKRNVFELLIEEAEEVNAGSDGIIILPHLSGSGTPSPNTSAKGVFYGIRLSHRKGHFVRALMESVAYMLKSTIEVFKTWGMAISEIRSFGGGSQSVFWNQIKADVCGLPVISSNNHEPGCLGAAILAGIGSGVYKNIEEGCKRLVAIRNPQYPNKKNSSLYEDSYKEYLKLNKIMKIMYE